MQIRIDGRDLPGLSCTASPDAPGSYRNVHVGVQRHGRRDEVLGLIPGDAPAATWTLERTVTPSAAGPDLRGPFVQGPPGGRFIYLSWVTVDDARCLTLFRRAKLGLDAVPTAVLDSALDQGLLVGRLGLTDPRGHPVCASVRPPAIDWSAATAGPAHPKEARGT